VETNFVRGRGLAAILRWWKSSRAVPLGPLVVVSSTTLRCGWQQARERPGTYRDLTGVRANAHSSRRHGGTVGQTCRMALSELLERIDVVPQVRFGRPIMDGSNLGIACA
jgi:hypothetical protein